MPPIAPTSTILFPVESSADEIERSAITNLLSSIQNLLSPG
jgi:hypothetical protein